MRVPSGKPGTKAIRVAARLFARGCDGRLFRQLAVPGHGGNDLSAVKAAVFDEDVAGIFTSDNHARHVKALDVCLQRIGIHLRFASLRIEVNSLRFEKFEVGMIAGHGKHTTGWNRLFSLTILYPDLCRLDARNVAVEVRLDLSRRD